MTDSNAFREWINSKGLKMKFVAERMGITRYSLQKKIDNLSEFKVSEILTLSTEFDMSPTEREKIFFNSK